MGMFFAPDSHDPPSFLLRIILLFVGIGLYTMFGRLVRDAIARQQVFYGLTNQRVIIVSNFFIHQTKRLRLRNLSDVSLREFGDRRDITFGTGPSWINDPYGSLPASLNPATMTFELIDNAKHVFELTRATRAKAA